MTERKVAADKADEEVKDVKDDGVTLEVAGKDEEIPQFNHRGSDPQPGKGPDGVDVPSKDEKAFVVDFVTKPEVTSVNPEPYSEAELNHRFNHVPPADHVKHQIRIQGVTDR